ncbi:MAG: NAD-dependent epimerase/dehydratase family protein, partial [Planctomycetota bacterium]
MRVLVCGGAGYIGSNMTAMLAREGYQPVVFDNLSKGHREAVNNVQFVLGDFGDSNFILETLQKYSIEAVMHFAAFIEVGESVQEPLRYYENNVSKTRTLLAAMEKAGVNKFVFSSTAAVYGMP